MATTADSSTHQTAAERLVVLLDQAGVEVVFGIGGTHSLPMLGAFERSGSPRFVSARNEQGAGYMASGYARATGRPGVVITSTGPGALNALSALGDARFSSLPILHITTYADDDGDAFSGGIHESPHQNQVMALVGTKAVRASSADLDTPFWEAWNACGALPFGQVTLEIFSRTWNQEASLVGAPRPPGGVPVRPAGDLGPLVDAIAAARRPLLFCGGGVARSHAADAVVALAEHLDAPIMTSFQGKGVAGERHPLLLGTGPAEPAMRELASESDLVLVLGSKVSHLGTGGWTLPLPQQAFRIDPERDAHAHYPQMATIAGDARTACEKLLASAGARRSTGTAERVAAIRARVDADVAARGPEELQFVRELADGLPKDASLAFDMNKASFWCMKYLPLHRSGLHVMSSYMCMGSAIPMAVGLAEAGRPHVAAFVGDGGFQMGSSELPVIVERSLPIAIVVFVDGAYGLLRDNGRGEVRGAEHLGIDLWNPDYAELAKVFGFGHEVARSGRDLAAALDITGPTVVEVPLSFVKAW